MSLSLFVVNMGSGEHWKGEGVYYKGVVHTMHM